MQKENKRGIASLLIGMALVLSSSCALAEDIDIFVGASGGAAAAPVVMILLDSTNDWSSDLPNGTSKITALKAALDDGVAQLGHARSMSCAKVSGPEHGAPHMAGITACDELTAT